MMQADTDGLNKLMFPILNGVVCATEASPNSLLPVDKTDSFSCGNSSSDCSWCQEKDNEVEQNSEQNINIESSSDVVIGPVTRFHGPVTIYQNLPNVASNHGQFMLNERNRTQKNALEFPKSQSPNNDILVGSEKIQLDSDIQAKTTCSSPASLISDNASSPFNSANNSNPEKYNLDKLFQRCTNIRWMYLSICLIILALILLATTLFLTTSSSSSTDITDSNATEPPVTSTTESSRNETGKIKIITRNQWGAVEWKDRENLNRPIQKVVIAHTAGAFCRSQNECIRRVRDTQSQFMKDGYSDICYNFLIGGDGNIYEGTSWHYKSCSESYFRICVMGNFEKDEFTDSMINATQHLLELGLVSNKFASNYILLPHNATKITLSPGTNVYKVIQHLPNFSSIDTKNRLPKQEN